MSRQRGRKEKSIKGWREGKQKGLNRRGREEKGEIRWRERANEGRVGDKEGGARNRGRERVRRRQRRREALCFKELSPGKDSWEAHALHIGGFHEHVARLAVQDCLSGAMPKALSWNAHGLWDPNLFRAAYKYSPLQKMM